MKKRTFLSLALTPTLLFAAASVTQAADKDKHGHGHGDHKRQTSPKGAKAYIVTPKDGKTVNRKFKVVFGLKGMGICPAGITAQGVPIPDTGHHHLLVDVDKLPPLNKPLSDQVPEKIKHFGKGQTEVTLELPPGKHTLQLVLADYGHVPHNPPVASERISIIVE